MAKNAEDTNGSTESLLQVSHQGACSTSSEDTGGGGGRRDYVTTDDELVVPPSMPGPGESWNDKHPLSSSTTSSEDTEEIGSQVSVNDHSALSQPPAPSLSSLSSPEVVPMTIDTCEDLWTRLHDIRINGCVSFFGG